MQAIGSLRHRIPCLHATPQTLERLCVPATLNRIVNAHPPNATTGTEGCPSAFLDQQGSAAADRKGNDAPHVAPFNVHQHRLPPGIPHILDAAENIAN